MGNDGGEFDRIEWLQMLYRHHHNFTPMDHNKLGIIFLSPVAGFIRNCPLLSCRRKFPEHAISGVRCPLASFNKNRIFINHPPQETLNG